MSDKELRGLFQRLAEILRDAGLGWVVESVAADIATGKESAVREHVLVTRPTAEEEADTGTPRRTRGAPATFTASTEYTASEQLGMLVARTRRVGVVNPQIALAALDSLSSPAGAHIDVIRFTSSDSPARSVGVTRSGVQDALAASVKLEELLAELERRAGITNGSY